MLFYEQNKPFTITKFWSYNLHIPISVRTLITDDNPFIKSKFLLNNNVIFSKSSVEFSKVS